VRFDVVVVGAGTAGCVLAARLSENPDRSVCLIEAGPDHGPSGSGRWPPELLDARSLAWTHGWGVGGEDGRPLGGRVVGGSSAVNACMVVEGSPDDYDEWGDGWRYDELRPYLERAKSALRTATANTQEPSTLHAAFLEAAVASGFRRLDDPNDPRSAVGAAPFPANVVEGVRWNAAFAYLDQARGRSNLVLEPDTTVARVELADGRTVGVVTAEGRRVEAELVVLAAGAYFSAAILLRSGIGPEVELRRHGIAVGVPLPVGERLLDHCGTDVAWTLAAGLEAPVGLFEAHAVVKAASSSCPEGSWDLHLLPWTYPSGEAGEYAASVIVFHMKPLSVGRLRLRSADPTDLPLVERRFLSHEDDLAPIVEGIATARRIAATEPLRSLLGTETGPGEVEPEAYVRATVRNYFHPAGTCAIGEVVDADGRVLGVDGLLVSDASVMPTIPRANTNLTTAAIAERIAETLAR
jgi:choline dehydrogenase